MFIIILPFFVFCWLAEAEDESQLGSTDNFWFCCKGSSVFSLCCRWI